MLPKVPLTVSRRLLALISTLGLADIAYAQTAVTWTGATNTTFSTNGNWDGASAPANNTTTNYAIFSGTPTVNPNLTGARSIAGLDFQTAGWTLSGLGLTVGAFGIDSAGAGTNTVSAPISVGVAGGTWSIGTGNTLELSGVLGGANGFIVDGPGKLVLSGSSANTHSSTITLQNGADLDLGKTGGVNALIGSTSVGDGSVVRWLGGSQTNAATIFTVGVGGLLDLNGFDAAFAWSGGGNSKITLSGGTVQTGSNTWTFGGNNSGSAIVNGTVVSTITGNVNLGLAGSLRGVSLADNATGLDLDIQANVTDAGLATGAGWNFTASAGSPEVRLSGNNDYRGAVTVGAGVTLYADNANALGTTAGSTTISTGGSLVVRGGLSYAENIVIGYSTTPGLRSESGNNTWAGNIANLGGSNRTPGTIQVDADSLTVTGSLAGFSNDSRQLGKTGAGALIYNNAANNIVGTIFANGGVFAFAPTGEVNVRGGNTALNGGAIAAPDNITMGLGTGSNQIRFGAAGGGFAAYGADIDANIGNAGAMMTWGGSTAAQIPTATVNGISVTGLSTIYFGGTGYSGTVNLGFTGGGGSGAAGTATITDGVVTGFNITAGGTGYSTAPTVTIAAPTGNGGTANFLADNAPLILNSTISAHKVTFRNALNLAAVSSTYTGEREIRVLDNTGSTADRGVISGIISSGKSGIGINKTGAGVLELTGVNTYNGITRITAGTLALGASNVLSNSSNIVLGGGTFAVGGFTDTVGTLSLTANSFLTLGVGGALVFADSASIDWGSSLLSVSGSFVDGVSLRFGSNEFGLTSAQLGKISINGGAAGIDAFGYLTLATIPESSAFAAFAGVGALALSALRRRRRA